MTQPLRNWAGNVGYGAASLATPTSVPELQELVAHSSRVKAIGTRHSFNRIADTQGTLVSTAGLPADIVIDDRAMTVRVNGASPYGVLAGELQSQGFALENMGSLPHISVAGATATGTHGSGDRNGILSTAIAAIDLVTADGTRITSTGRPRPVCDRRRARCLRRDRRLDAGHPAHLHGASGHLPERPLGRRVERVRRDHVQRVQRQPDGAFGGPTSSSSGRRSRLGDRDPAPVPGSLYGGSWYDDADLPEGHNLNVRGSIPGPWSERLPHFRLDSPPSVGGDELQSEWFVDRAHAAAALPSCVRWATGSPRTCTPRRSAPSPPTSCGSARRTERRERLLRLHLAKPSRRGGCAPASRRAGTRALPAAGALGEALRLDGAELTARYPRAPSSGISPGATTRPGSSGTLS